MTGNAALRVPGLRIQTFRLNPGLITQPAIFNFKKLNCHGVSVNNMKKRFPWDN